MTSAVHEYTYSVQVKSRFDLLARDDFNSEDPDILLGKLRSHKREPKSAVKEASEKSNKEVVEPPQKSAQTNRSERRAVEQKADAPDASSNVRNRANPRARGSFTRSKPSKANDKREFDRHSGSDKTGIKPVIKKDGHGTGNWGTIEDELEAQMAEVVLDPTAEEESPKEKLLEPVSEPDKPVEEEPKTLTLKEYREQLKSSKAQVRLATKGTRPPNDGKNVFSDMVQVHSSKPLKNDVEVVLEDVPKEDVDVPAFFEFGRGRPTPRGRGGRSGNAEFRGRGAGVRPDRRLREEPQVEDETQGEQQALETPEDVEAPNETGERPMTRGGRGGERRFRARGRGFLPRGRGIFFSDRGRGGFHPDRGRGRGGFNPNRGRGFAYEDRGRGGSHEDRGRGGFHEDRGRGGFHEDRGRGGFHEDRGRGGFHEDRGRGGFNPDRGRGGPVGDRSRGTFSDERGRGRGGASGAGDRPNFRGTRGGGRGMRSFGPRGGNFGPGGFRRARGVFDNMQDSRGGFNGGPPVAVNTAPSMDSDADFPALK